MNEVYQMYAGNAYDRDHDDRAVRMPGRQPMREGRAAMRAGTDADGTSGQDPDQPGRAGFGSRSVMTAMIRSFTLTGLVM